MRRHRLAAALLLVAGAGCAHTASTSSRAPASRTAHSAASGVDEGVAAEPVSVAAVNAEPSEGRPFGPPLMFSEVCLPRLMRLPARVDLDDMTERRPDGSERRREASLVAPPEIRLLRPVCVTAPTGTRCIDHPGTTQTTLHPSGRAVHAEGVAVFSMSWHSGVYATFEGFDTSVQLADTARLPIEGLVLDDCCESVRWSEDGTVHLTHVRGRVRPEDRDAHWHFLLDRPICGIGHVPGDERVVSSFTIEGKAALNIPIKGLPEVMATATLRGRSSASSSYAADVMLLVVDEGVRLHSGGVR